VASVASSAVAPWVEVEVAVGAALESVGVEAGVALALDQVAFDHTFAAASLGPPVAS
jgi:hypothetical protein